jgi:hypothetical protein
MNVVPEQVTLTAARCFAGIQSPKPDLFGHQQIRETAKLLVDTPFEIFCQLVSFLDGLLPLRPDLRSHGDIGKTGHEQVFAVIRSIPR